MTQYKVEDYLNLDEGQFSDSAEETGIYLTQAAYDEGFSTTAASVPVILAEVPKLARLSELSLLPQYNSSTGNRVEKKSVQRNRRDRVIRSFVKAFDKTLETSDSSLLSATPSPKSIFSYGFSSSQDEERAFSVVEGHLQIPQDDAYINDGGTMFKLALENSPSVSPEELELLETAPFANNNSDDILSFSQVIEQHANMEQDMVQLEPDASRQVFDYLANLERSVELTSLTFEDQFDVPISVFSQMPQQMHVHMQAQLPGEDEDNEEEEEEAYEEEEEDEEEEETYTEEPSSNFTMPIPLQLTPQPVFHRLQEVRPETLGSSPRMNNFVPEKKRRKLSIQPLTFDQIRLTHGLLRKTMIRHYDTEDLKLQIKKEIAKEQKAVKDALKRPDKAQCPKKRTISKTRLQDVSINFHQALTGLRDLEVVFAQNHILSSGYWSAKANALGVTEMRSIVSVIRQQYENHITFEFVDDDVNPNTIPDGMKLLKFSVISRYCEHLENDRYVNDWVHLITYNDLSELLGFALDISDEMIVVNDDSLIFETQNEPWKRLLMRWRSIYDKKLFIISESKEMMQLKIEKAKSRGKPFNLDEREKKLKEDLFNQLMSYKGLLGAPSKTAKDQALIKTNKLQALIKIVLEKYCWVDPSKVPEGGYRRLF
ncbi:AEL056Wp [Eremothecium gossypii ATCC 10895]|uniref:AEL056Wp n=1 Tax=Eremothecium gossypii (strain ATCC 10895 / CBS 109.51 / FGSC 9923 / NRRL Y-1056) TaxID=284811 RepID=Q757R8_EREGS|nr:AEL056Wp [Eremothecium gossypii ATCC 10895]AAS52629.1 AEL056Wp [Eremothecium gossypii ATCC 10895]